MLTIYSFYQNTNLDIIPSKDKLYNSNLNYLFEYFNSDKGDFVIINMLNHQNKKKIRL